MGKAIFFVKWSLLILVPAKALEAVEAGQKSPFLKSCQLFSFLEKPNFLKAAFTISLYLLDEMETNAYHGSNVKTSVF
jgi:hypothetical protein